MKFTRLAIPDVVMIEPKVFGDARGFFMETWQKKVFIEAGIAAEFVQDNHSRSRKGILRGLHYQIHNPQGKLVRAIFGEIFDVAVDLRKSSPTFGHWVGELLSADNKRMMWVPEGFAHGFYVTSDEAEVVYKTTDYYTPHYERCISWDDPALAIEWPLQGEPILSEKDRKGSDFHKAECY